MCHPAVAQLDTSYPAVHPVMAIAQSPLPRLNQILELVDYLYLYENTVYRASSERNSHSFVSFPDVRNCALGPQNPKRDSDLALNPHRSVSSQPGSLLKKKRQGILSKKEEEDGNQVTAFRPRERSRSLSSDWRSQLIDRHRGAFQPIA